MSVIPVGAKVWLENYNRTFVYTDKGVFEPVEDQDILAESDSAGLMAAVVVLLVLVLLVAVGVGTWYYTKRQKRRKRLLDKRPPKAKMSTHVSHMESQKDSATHRAMMQQYPNPPPQPPQHQHPSMRYQPNTHMLTSPTIQLNQNNSVFSVAESYADSCVGRDSYVQESGNPYLGHQTPLSPIIPMKQVKPPLTQVDEQQRHGEWTPDTPPPLNKREAEAQVKVEAKEQMRAEIQAQVEAQMKAAMEKKKSQVQSPSHQFKRVDQDTIDTGASSILGQNLISLASAEPASSNSRRRSKSRTEREASSRTTEQRYKAAKAKISKAKIEEEYEDDPDDDDRVSYILGGHSTYNISCMNEEEARMSKKSGSRFDRHKNNHKSKDSTLSMNTSRQSITSLNSSRGSFEGMFI